MDYRSIITNELDESAKVLQAFLSDSGNIDAINRAGALMVEAFRNGNKAISCGNGGSMADAIHFAEELTGKFRNNRNPIPAIAISDPGYLSCVSNDFGYKEVFSRFVQGVGTSGDVLLAISTSGNSDNVNRAARMAKQLNMNVVALTGKNGGELANIADVEIRVPHQGFSDRIQEIHIKVIHIMILMIEKGLKG